VLKKLVIAAMPEFALNKINARKERGIVPEILKLDIQQTTVEENYVKVAIGNGRIFYGLSSSDLKRSLYRNIKKYFPDALRKIVTEDNFETIYEIVSRYSAPRSLPGELTRHASSYRPIRDPLSDFRYDDAHKRSIAKQFCPRPNDVFLDVGAFMGYGTIRIADYMQGEGKIIAVEADPDIAEILRLNIKANKMDCVTVVETAVSDVQEVVTFYKTKNTVNSLNDVVLEKLGHSDFKKISIKTQRVDDILKINNIDRVNKINITINGGEMKALESMRPLLETTSDMTITLAGWYTSEDGLKICDVVKKPLEAMGFVVLIGELGRVLAYKKQN